MPGTSPSCSPNIRGKNELTIQKTHSATVTTGPNAYEADEKRKGQKIIDLDCRGLEFVEFKPDVRLRLSPSLYIIREKGRIAGCLEYAKAHKPQGEWEAKGTESSTPFTGIDLSDGEWYDYDEKAGDEVSVKEINWDIAKV